MSRDSATVSNNMRKIHSKDTSIELLLSKSSMAQRLSLSKKNYKALLVLLILFLPNIKLLFFCDSEFFHGKNWEILKLRLEKGKIQILDQKNRAKS